jgi:hypothetical protein
MLYYNNIMMAAKSKTFKQQYDSDPVFRAKHLENIKKKTQCQCGQVLSKCNMSHHKKSETHIRIMKLIDENNELKSRGEQLQEKIDQLVREKKKLNRELKKLQ